MVLRKYGVSDAQLIDDLYEKVKIDAGCSELGFIMRAKRQWSIMELTSFIRTDRYRSSPRKPVFAKIILSLLAQRRVSREISVMLSHLVLLNVTLIHQSALC